jgi:E3 SUMO-protein ligase NSE2
MSTARRLVQRGRQHEGSSPAQRNRHQRRDAEVHNGPTPLPPYEPPACPLTANAQEEIEKIQTRHASSKYQKHLKCAIDAITTATADNNERLATHKAQVQRDTEKRRNNNIPDDEKPERHIQEEAYTNGLERQVSDLTRKAEKALRDLIDYGDELVMKDSIMKEVSENLAAAPVARHGAGRRRRGSEAQGDEEEAYDENAPAADENILSAVELLKEAKEEYTRKYTSKSMMDR